MATAPKKKLALYPSAIGGRIRLARELCGLTQSELAEEIGTTQPGMASLESGRYQPSPEFLHRVASGTGLNIRFFERGDLPELSAGSLLYRSNANVKQTIKAQAHAHCLVAFDLAEFLAKRLKPLPANIPRLSESPETSAQITRSLIGISPNTPIKALIRALEKSGVFVFAIPLSVDGLNGFSCWAGERSMRPVIAVLDEKPGYRSVFTISEELGHLVLRNPLTVSVADADDQVRAFAREFLLPREAMEMEMEQPVTLSSLAYMKSRWGASIQFLAKRARSLEFLSANQYRYLMQQITNAGWRKREPGDDLIKSEKPKLLKTMAELLYGNPVNVAKLSAESGLTGKQLRSILGLEDAPPSRVLEFKSRSQQTVSDESTVLTYA